MNDKKKVFRTLQIRSLLHFTETSTDEMNLRKNK